VSDMGWAQKVKRRSAGRRQGKLGSDLILFDRSEPDEALCAEWAANPGRLLSCGFSGAAGWPSTACNARVLFVAFVHTSKPVGCWLVPWPKVVAGLLASAG